MALTAGNWLLTTQVSISGAKIAAQGNASANTLAVPSYGPSAADQQTLAFGTATGQADILCAVQDTLTAGASATYDLYANGAPALYGQTANFRKLRSVCVVINSGGDAAGVRVGGAGTNPTPLFFADASDMALIFPSGPPFAQGSDAGVAVTTAARNLKVENLGAVSVTYTVFLAGTSV